MGMVLGMTKFDEYCEKFIERKTIEDIQEENIVFFVLFCQSDKTRRLLPLPLLRTVRVTFVTYGSSELSSSV